MVGRRAARQSSERQLRPTCSAADDVQASSVQFAHRICMMPQQGEPYRPRLPPTAAVAALQGAQQTQAQPQHELVVSLADFDLSKVGNSSILCVGADLRASFPGTPPHPAGPARRQCCSPLLPARVQSKLRLDAFLAAKLPAASRARLQASIKEGLVAVNGRQVGRGAGCIRNRPMPAASRNARPPCIEQHVHFACHTAHY